ncbi:MAG TPA: glycosyltransferase family 2 protein [Bacteroidota bacterium]|nr:glycosyltransferase family 2 protein [Bacteroidota bacterium]
MQHQTDEIRADASVDEAIDISVVVPSYNEKESLPELSERLRVALDAAARQWEVWLIDDGSNDGSDAAMRALHASDPRFKVIRFRRNYGKSAALALGFKHARGRVVITMDADLQDDPAEIPNLIAKLDQGYDMVSGWKKKRHDPLSKTLPSRFFNFVTGKMSGIDIHDFNCGLKGYRSDVVKSVRIYGEMHRYIPVLAKMAGFTVAEIPVQHHARKYGKTKFGLSRFFKGFLDLMTVMFTSRYTQRPLHVFGTIGSLMFGLGLLINLWLTIEWLMGHPVSNRPMLLLGILLMLLGIQLISTGLIAEMIAKNDTDESDYSIRDFLS